MKRLALAVLLIASISVAQTLPSRPDAQGLAPTKNTTVNPQIVIPAGTTVSLALTNPILARSAKVGDSVYAETAFPVAVNNQMAIPSGTYVQGQIDTLIRPGWLSPHAEFQMHFTKIIFANGYTIPLNGSDGVGVGLPTAIPDDVIAAVAKPYVLVSSTSDVLLDNGSQLEMVLQIPLRLDAAKVAAALRQSNPGLPDQFKSATRCRPIPGSPGSPDTVIPGTPGTPGTPDIVIPGAPGMPPTVIPGTPATPGTPDTVMHGSPSTPYMPCPAPPVVTSYVKLQNYRETFQIAARVQLSGKSLSAGSYQAAWRGPGFSTQVDISQNGNPVVSVPARVVILNRKSPADVPGTQADSGGTISLQSLRFAGQNFALYFDQAVAQSVP